MIREIGYCHGIENYARHLTGRAPGRTAADAARLPARRTRSSSSTRAIRRCRRSAACITATGRARKCWSSYGFRLPSALDNRPLNFEEWESAVGQVVFVSATPGPYELSQGGGVVVEQIIRPTGLIDPPIDVRPVRGQVDDLLQEIRQRAAGRERVLVTTLTKRMAEDLTQYYQELGVRVRYLHSDIETLERVEILRDLRRGRVRRAGGDQPAARGARPAGGVARRDPRRGQGGVSALGAGR